MKSRRFSSKGNIGRKLKRARHCKRQALTGVTINIIKVVRLAYSTRGNDHPNSDAPTRARRMVAVSDVVIYKAIKQQALTAFSRNRSIVTFNVLMLGVVTDLTVVSHERHSVTFVVKTIFFRFLTAVKRVDRSQPVRPCAGPNLIDRNYIPAYVITQRSTQIDTVTP